MRQGRQKKRSDRHRKARRLKKKTGSGLIKKDKLKDAVNDLAAKWSNSTS